VIVVAALLSGLVERSGVPQVAIFLGLGAALGPGGFAALDVGLHSPALQIAATLSLALILFTDALTLDLREAREHRALALLAVGPGTVLSALLFAAAAWALLDLPRRPRRSWEPRSRRRIPVLLKGCCAGPTCPRPRVQALRLESGLNDVRCCCRSCSSRLIVQGVGAAERDVVVAAAASTCSCSGPGAGVLVGVIGLVTLDRVRGRLGVRRDYESLYSLGIAVRGLRGRRVGARQRVPGRVRRPGSRSPRFDVDLWRLLPRVTARPRPSSRCCSRSCCWAAR
jgi:NhaP-type Na+/H+ or K+/H+ antiporter